MADTETLTRPVRVRLVFGEDETTVIVQEVDGDGPPQWADGDNLEKAILDGMQGLGGLLADDRDVRWLAWSFGR